MEVKFRRNQSAGGSEKGLCHIKDRYQEVLACDVTRGLKAALHFKVNYESGMKCT